MSGAPAREFEERPSTASPITARADHPASAPAYHCAARSAVSAIDDISDLADGERRP